MTANYLYRLWCDTGGCPNSVVVDNLRDRPDGWIEVRSTAHLADWRPGKTLILANNRKHKDQRTHSEIHGGAFALDLCPTHPHTFAGHQPATEGITAGSGRRPTTTVSCACGWSTWGVPQERVVGRRPAHASEWEWWRHLPAELQQYAARNLDYRNRAIAQLHRREDRRTAPAYGLCVECLDPHPCQPFRIAAGTI